jgi:flagellar biosynthetic protein FliP
VAAGLNMVQPVVVSLPLKVLLFVVADGWFLIVRGLVLSYA